MRNRTVYVVLNGTLDFDVIHDWSHTDLVETVMEERLTQGNNIFGTLQRAKNCARGIWNREYVNNLMDNSQSMSNAFVERRKLYGVEEAYRYFENAYGIKKLWGWTKKGNVWRIEQSVLDLVIEIHEIPIL